jgi:hypothetical protein
VPVASIVNGRPVISGFEQSMENLKSSQVALGFPVQLSPEGIYSLKSTANDMPGHLFEWEPATGVLRSDGDVKYSATQEGGPESPLIVSITNKDGEVESYFFDRARGVGVHRRVDGSVVSRSYFMGGGVLFSKLRNIVVKNQSGEEITESYSYDELGRLLRVRGANYLKSFQWNPDGTLKMKSEIRNEQEIMREEFDENGRPLLRRYGALQTRFAYEGDRRSIAKFANNKLVSATILGKDMAPVPLELDGNGKLVPTKPEDTKLSNEEISRFQEKISEAAQISPK